MISYFNLSGTYQLRKDADEIRQRLRFISTRRFDDYSTEIIGWIREDGRFAFSNKWSFASWKKLENHTAYLQGEVIPTSDASTIVRIHYRPNILFQAFFLCALAALLLTITSGYYLPFLSPFAQTLLFAVLSLASLFAMFYGTIRLKRRFESHTGFGDFSFSDRSHKNVARQEKARAL